MFAVFSASFSSPPSFCVWLFSFWYPVPQPAPKPELPPAFSGPLVQGLANRVKFLGDPADLSFWAQFLRDRCSVQRFVTAGPSQSEILTRGSVGELCTLTTGAHSCQLRVLSRLPPCVWRLGAPAGSPTGLLPTLAAAASPSGAALDSSSSSGAIASATTPVHPRALHNHQATIVCPHPPSAQPGAVWLFLCCSCVVFSARSWWWMLASAKLTLGPFAPRNFVSCA